MATVTDLVQRELEKLDSLLLSSIISQECYDLRRAKVIDEAVKPEPPEDVTTIYVGHVQRSLEKTDVWPTFAKYGAVAKIEMLPSASKKPRKEWWAVFVEFETHAAAAAAIYDLNNSIPFDWPGQNKPLFLKWAGTKEQTDEYQRQQYEKQQQMAAFLPVAAVPMAYAPVKKHLFPRPQHPHYSLDGAACNYSARC